MKKIIDEIKRGEITIYKSTAGPILDVRLDKNTVWLTQDQMADLFEKGRTTITEHIQNVFKERELLEKAVCREFRRTGSDGKIIT